MPMKFDLDAAWQSTDCRRHTERQLYRVYIAALELAPEIAFLRLNDEDTPEELRPKLDDVYRALKKLVYAMNDRPFDPDKNPLDWDPAAKVIGLPFTAKARG